MNDTADDREFARGFEELPLVDFAHLSEIRDVVGTDTFNRLMQGIIAELPTWTDRVGQIDDAKTLANTAHQLVSILGNHGFLRASAQARHVEGLLRRGEEEQARGAVGRLTGMIDAAVALYLERRDD